MDGRVRIHTAFFVLACHEVDRYYESDYSVEKVFQM